MEQIIKELTTLRSCCLDLIDYNIDRANYDTIEETDEQYCRGKAYAYNFVQSEIERIIKIAESWREYYDEA